MGKVFSVITRPLRNFNVESRAHKVISKEKPVPAPHFEANIIEAEKLIKENPESIVELLKKDAILDTHLKNIYVKSYDPIDESNVKIIENPNRPLPLNRKIVEFQEFGYLEPKIIPPGRITLKQVLKLLSSHQMNLKDWDNAKEALNYNISEDNLKNILHYFKIYHIYLPKKTTMPIGTPELPPQRIESGFK